MSKQGVVTDSRSKSLTSKQADITKYILIDTNTNIYVQDWSIEGKDFAIDKKLLHGGKQEGSELLTITSKNGLTIKLIPTRGLGILSVEGQDGTKLAWDSPIKEVVHPKFIELDSRSGLGWLDGFNEVLVRCGYEWTGHPVQTDKQNYTLHGRAANIPVSKLIVEIENQAPYTITVKGLISERTFKFSNLDTWVSVSYVPGTEEFTVHDVLTNNGDYPQEYEVIYHSNFGAPILEKEAKFIAPVASVAPFNEYAAKFMDSWDTYLGRTENFDENLLTIIPYATKNGSTQVMLSNQKGSKGVGIAYNINQLPVFTLWKNTDLQHAGYVTGLEAGTNFPYNITIEREQGRVKQLAAGASTEFTLTYSLLSSKPQVRKYKEEIEKIQGKRKTKVSKIPTAKV